MPVLSYRQIPIILALKDHQHPDQDLGTLELAVTLTPKDSPLEERQDPMVRMLLLTESLVQFKLVYFMEYLPKNGTGDVVQSKWPVSAGWISGLQLMIAD